MILRCGGKKRCRGAQSAHWPALWVAVGRTVCSALSSKQAAWEWCIQPNSFLNERSCQVSIHPSKFLPNNKAPKSRHIIKANSFLQITQPSPKPFHVSEDSEEGATVELTKSQARSRLITRQAHTQDGQQRAAAAAGQERSVNNQQRCSRLVGTFSAKLSNINWYIQGPIVRGHLGQGRTGCSKGKWNNE
jgi:hypothetical protein